MADNDTTGLLDIIGQRLAEDAGNGRDRTLLYAELDDGYIALSLFRDAGNHIQYIDPPAGDRYLILLKLWEKSRPRWTTIEYLLTDGTFEVSYAYADTIDDDEDPSERRNRVMRRHFGDKPLVYPAWNNAQYDL